MTDANAATKALRWRKCKRKRPSYEVVCDIPVKTFLVAVSRFASPEFDALANQPVGDVCIRDSQPPTPQRMAVCILDSPPPDPQIQGLMGFLRSLCYDVQVKCYKDSQIGFECGYKSIIAVYELCSPGHFVSVKMLVQESRPGCVISFFNTIIEHEPRSIAIRLSEQNIRQIMRCMEFLHSNFHLYTRDFITANTFVDLLLKIRNSFLDAARETANYNCSKPFTVTTAHLVNMIDAISINCKDGEFRLLLKRIWEMLNRSDADLDYRQIAEALMQVLNNFELPGWFDGTFSYGEFKRHMLALPERIHVDEGRRSAIVNTHERPGEHWFVVAYALQERKQRLSENIKAIEG